jgi:hypothetical protein
VRDVGFLASLLHCKTLKVHFSSVKVVLPVVLCVCHRTLGEERKLRMFENRMFRRVAKTGRAESVGA